MCPVSGRFCLRCTRQSPNFTERGNMQRTLAWWILLFIVGKVDKERAATGSPYSRPSLLDGQHSELSQSCLAGDWCCEGASLQRLSYYGQIAVNHFSGRFCCLRKSLWKRGYRWKGRFARGIYFIGLQ